MSFIETTPWIFKLDLDLDMTNETINTDNYTSNTSSSTSTPPICEDDYAEWGRVYEFLLTAVPAFLIIVGTFGNTISYCVLRQKSYKNNVMAGALRYLACVDNICLWTINMEIFLRGSFNIHVAAHSYEMCLLVFYGTNALISLDAWILVFITSTRFIHIRFPFKVKIWCTKFNYYITLVLMHVFVLGAMIGMMLSVYIQLPRDKPMSNICYYIVTSVESTSPIYLIIKISVTYIGPSVILFIINVLTIWELGKVERRHKILANRKPSVPVAGPTSSYKTTTVTTISNRTDSSQNAISTEVDAPVSPRHRNKNCNLGLPKVDSINTEETSGGENKKITLYKYQYPHGDRCEGVDDKNQSANKDESGVDGKRPVKPYHVSMTGLGVKGPNSRQSVLPRLSITSGVMSQITEAKKRVVAIDEPTTTDKMTTTSATTVSSKYTDSHVNYDSEKSQESKASQRKQNTRVSSLTRLLIVSSFIYLSINIPYAIFHLFLLKIILPYIKGCYLQMILPYAAFLILIYVLAVGCNFFPQGQCPYWAGCLGHCTDLWCPLPNTAKRRPVPNSYGCSTLHPSPACRDFSINVTVWSATALLVICSWPSYLKVVPLSATWGRAGSRSVFPKLPSAFSATSNLF